MKLADVRKNAFAMPLNNPAYPRGPYKFYNREFVIVTYRTDPELLRAVVPEPLEVVGDTVNARHHERVREAESSRTGTELRKRYGFGKERVVPKRRREGLRDRRLPVQVDLMMDAEGVVA